MHKFTNAHAHLLLRKLYAPPQWAVHVCFQNPTSKLSSRMAVASGESKSSYDTIEFDEYGFLIPQEDQDNLESRSHQYR